MFRQAPTKLTDDLLTSAGRSGPLHERRKQVYVHGTRRIEEDFAQGFVVHALVYGGLTSGLLSRLEVPSIPVIPTD